MKPSSVLQTGNGVFRSVAEVKKYSFYVATFRSGTSLGMFYQSICRIKIFKENYHCTICANGYFYLPTDALYISFIKH
jgi:hypothetical protein